jgi:inner membrane protein
MASLGHLAVGIAAARVANRDEQPTWRSMAAWSALSMVPDSDVIGMALGVPYEHAWGHRGATHSLLLAAGIAAVVGLAAPLAGRLRARTWLIATVVIASHSLLDTLTDGGLGCALFWPFDLTRYFAPWQPIPVSPIGPEYLSAQGAVVAASELVLFGPLLWFAFRRQSSAHLPQRRTRLRRAAWIITWLAGVWIIGSSDPLRQRLIGAIVREHTEYAAGFSENAFARVTVGMKEPDVLSLLGRPLEQWWLLADGGGECRVIRFVDDAVARWSNFDRCTPPGVQIGMSPAAVRDRLGRTGDMCWDYSRSGGGRPFQGRGICFEDGEVLHIMSRWVPRPPE